MKEFKILVDNKDIRHHVYADNKKAAIKRYCDGNYVEPSRVKAILVK